MNFELILGLLLMCALDTTTSASIVNKSQEDAYCQDKTNITDDSTNIPNKVFKEIMIGTIEDLLLNITQLEIMVHPQTEFINSTALIILSSHEESCQYSSEHKFSLNKSLITVPNPGDTAGQLRPGCRYSIIFSVDTYCIYRHYKIPEPKACSSYLSEDTFDTFPNKIINNVTVGAFRKNAIRLNISFSPNPEYAYEGGIIAISSRMARCNHPEEFTFFLGETQVTVPRVEYPHSFINSGCEYMIDFEIAGYCATTTYKVPDFCIGKEPRTKIVDVEEEQYGIFKVYWEPIDAGKNESYSVKDISYRLEDVPYETFSDEMVIENRFEMHYSKLNLSKINRHKTYKLFGDFLNDDECSNESSITFRVASNHKAVIIMLSTFFVVFIMMVIIYFYVPLTRTKLINIFKLIFGVPVPVSPPQTSEVLYYGVKRKEVVNPNYLSLEQENSDEYEIPRFKIEIQPDIDPRKGFFGIVRFGRIVGLKNKEGYTPVAIKMVKESAPDEELDALIEEIDTMKKITEHGNHENVVKMLGYCTLQKPHLLLLELVTCGDLKNYLHDLRNEWSNKRSKTNFFFPDSGSNGLYISPPNVRTVSETSSNYPPSPTETESTFLCDEMDDNSPLCDLNTPKKVEPALSHIELQNFALQIAKGMAFLESISLVHRDLAARNVLISDKRVLKISDFGMSRIGSYVHRNTGRQPIRWMAPESIEKFICSSKSDVWSFGVVLWEIGTLGAFPYDSVTNDIILEYLLYSLKKGTRLMRPEICTDELYSLMLKCWSENPDDRPSFQQIVDHLNGEKKKIYIDFQKLNPAYVFPPTKQSRQN